MIGVLLVVAIVADNFRRRLILNMNQ
ncbi:MAG: hypothetical protein ACI9I4_001859 [Neolewinella sp.]